MLLEKKYPPTWRINDWEAPWLPGPVRLLNRFPASLMRKYACFDEQALLEQARCSTGLADFGDDDFLEPFRILLEDLNNSDNFTLMGRITAHTILQQQLCARLNIEDRLKHDVSIADDVVDRPVIIAGLPRTGTTHLHNLLSQVTGLRYLPWWQTLDPVQSWQQRQQRDRRRSVNRVRLGVAGYILPLFKRMHEMELDMPHEELTLSALCYRSFFFESAFQAPRYRAWYASQDHSRGYAYMKRILQILQSEGPAQGKAADARWILKSPQHVDQLDAILRVYPDAKIILTHRDPVRAVLSMITMILYSSRQVYRPTRLKQEAAAWLDRLEQMLRRSREQAGRLPAANILDVHFDRFMEDPQQTITEVLDFAGVENDARSQAAIRRHLQSHTRDRHGRIDYSFADLGLDEQTVAERFAFYQL